LNLRGTAFYGAVAAAAVVLDQWVKYLVENGLDMHVQVDVLPTLALYRTHNTGIAFSMFSDLGSVGLTVITLAVIGFVGWIAIRTDARQRMARFGFALIIGGAIGNLIDRAWHGYVIDYVLFHLPQWSFAIFNLADAFITVGAAMVILDEFLVWWRGRAEARD
jgi:signal peptidase II